MKRNLLVCGMLPALALGMCSTAMAAAPGTSDASAVKAAEPAPVTEQFLQDMRAQLEEQLRQAQELQNRLNAQMDSLNKRMTKVEHKNDNPVVDVHGYARLRWDKQNFEGFKAADMKTIWINLFTNYRINDRWYIRSEHEFENNLSRNTGAYEGDSGYDYDKGGKQYSRPVLQLYADGRIGEVEVKLGRFYLNSPYTFTFDEKVDGWQAKWGTPTRWGRKANFTLSSGNTYSKVLYGDKDNKLDPWGEGGSTQFRVLSLMGEIPVAKNTNICTHYGKVTRRETQQSRKTFSLGFDTKLNRDLSLQAAFAKSDSDTLNRSHFLKLQYKECNPGIPGSYDIYIKKYLQRGHTGLTNWFNDDIVDPTAFGNALTGASAGSAWDHRCGEFNGLRIGIDFVPVRNTKLLVNYTFGQEGLFDAGTGNLTGKKDNYSFFRTQWEMYF